MTEKHDDHSKRPSLADYLVRYDLARMIEEAKQDYNQASPGPRLLNQRDITARFRRPGPRRPSHGHGQAQQP